MIKKFLKIAGVKNEQEFYKKYPTEAAFFKAHPDAKDLKKHKKGGEMKKLKQLTSYQGDIDGIMPIAQGGDVLSGWQDQMWGTPSSITGAMPSAPANPNAVQTYMMDSNQTGPSQALGLNDSPLGKITTPTSAPTRMSFLDKIGGAAGIVGLAENIVGGIGDIKAQREAYKRAQQTNKLVGLAEQAVLSGLKQPETKRKYAVRERQPFTIEEMGLPFQGNPVNYLAQDGAMIGGNPTEIQNMYNPGDMYSNLGYEPLSDSENVKQYRYGGMPQAQGGFNLSSLTPIASRFTDTAFDKIGLNKSATGNLAGNVLGTAGSAFLGPLGGIAGQFVGKALGSVLDPTARKMEKLNKDSERRAMNLGLMSGMRDTAAQFSGFMEEGGYVSHNWNPQVIAKFGDLSAQQVQDYALEGMDNLRTGGNIRNNYMSYDEDQLMSMDFGGQLKVMDGGYAEPIGSNPYLPNTGQVLMLRGRSHDDGGMPMKYGDNVVEAEGGEPVVELADNGTVLPDGSPDVNAVIAGNLQISGDAASYANNPKLKGMKYKNAVRDIAKRDDSISKKRDKNMNILSEMDIRTPFDKLKANSLAMNEMGFDKQHLANAEAINKLMEYQNNINDTAEKMSEMMGKKVNTDALAKGKLKFEGGNNSYNTAQTGKKMIKKSEEEAYIKQGYKRDPKNPNRLVRKGSKDVVIKGSEAVTRTVEAKKAPGKGSPEFNRAFAQARKQGLKEFEWNGKKYTTDLYKPGTTTEVVKEAVPDKTESTPFEEDVYLQDEAKTTVQTTTKKPLDYGMLASGLSGLFRPSDALGYLKGPQIYGELAALSMNQLEPVFAQGLQPLLRQPYRVSLDRQRNDVRSTFANAKRLTSGDPAAQAMIASEEATQLQAIGDKEFQANQAEFANTYAENRQMLNFYDRLNQQTFDTQQDRATQARAATKATAQEAISSMADKQLKRELEDAYLRVGENMYNYRFGPDYRIQNYNPFAYFQMPVVGQQPMPPVNQSTTAQTTTAAPTETGKTGKSVSKKNKYNSSLVKALKNM